MTELLLPGCPIRVSVSLCLLAARHGFSQLSTPFFALIRLGIRLTPFVVLLSPFYPNVLFSFPVQFSKNLLEVLVGLGRLELPTSRLSGVRSNQLSYKPISLRLYNCSLFLTGMQVFLAD